MALDESALLDLLTQLKAIKVADRERTTTEKFYRELTDAEAAAFISEPFEWTAGRVAQRNGTRAKTSTTMSGQFDLWIMKMRQDRCSLLVGTESSSRRSSRS